MATDWAADVKKASAKAAVTPKAADRAEKPAAKKPASKVRTAQVADQPRNPLVQTVAAGTAAGTAAALFAGEGQPSGSDEEGGTVGWLLWLVAAALILGLLWWVFGGSGSAA